jgi:hypothetical protein
LFFEYFEYDTTTVIFNNLICIIMAIIIFDMHNIINIFVVHAWYSCQLAFVIVAVIVSILWVPIPTHGLYPLKKCWSVFYISMFFPWMYHFMEFIVLNHEIFISLTRISMNVSFLRNFYESHGEIMEIFG